MDHTAWFTKKITTVLEAFGSHEENGLASEEAKNRLSHYGPNKLPDEKLDSIFLIFFRQFQSPLIYILLIASIIIFFIGEFVDGFTILFVLLFNALVGTIQEGKAQGTLAALKKFVETNAYVIRDGKQVIIIDYEVVPGDIILLSEGNKIPADARVILSNNLTIDEAALTGESDPVDKIADMLSDRNIPTSDQKNMVFKGTHIVAGSGQAVVVATGLQTVLGKISKEIKNIDTEIPLKKNIRYLTRIIIIVALSICTTIFIAGILLGHPIKEMFATVVSLAVSIIPEGLPVVMTVVLAGGVWQMSKRNAFVKKLQAVEALGQAQVIAVDKTGTLTKNEIVLQKVYVNDELFDVHGTSYRPEGEITLEGKKIDPLNHADLLFAGKIAAFGTHDGIVFDEATKEWKPTGDPTESALSVFAQKVGFHKGLLEKESPKIFEIPFDYKKKFHAVIHRVNGKRLATVIGAPEALLELATHIWHKSKSSKLLSEKKKVLEEVFIAMSKEGLRVLAYAIKENASDVLSSQDLKELTFVGFFGLKDVLRKDVYAAIEKAQAAGIKIVMITGDHKITAQAIAKEAGIYHAGEIVVTGEEMEKLSHEELAKLLEKVSVFARVTPEDKLKIVQAYKKQGKIIAMTGDGVNDAPSLVAADLGIGMGKSGTEVAKEAADILLLDDNFASIVAAIEEGRSIYKTIKKVMLYLFSTSFGEALTIAGALFLGFPLPILAAQIVWMNFVTDGFLDVSLAMEPKDEDVLKGNFTHPKKYLLNWLDAQRMIIMALPMMIGTLFLFHNYYHQDMVKAWTVSLTVLAVFQWCNAWNCRHESKSLFQLNPFSNIFLITATMTVFILQLFAIYNPIMQKLLHTTALSLGDWLVIIPIAATIIIAEEVRKFMQRLKTKSKTSV